LGDHATFYYVKDVMVHSSWQRKRVGTTLMQAINNWLEKNAADNALVGLITGEGLESFYQQFGFAQAFSMIRYIHRWST
jgi:GNAT superfamily N-acetyltransferase